MSADSSIGLLIEAGRRRVFASALDWPGFATALGDPASLITPPKGWLPRTAIRRMAWHVLDHLWEIEDKS